MNNKRIFTLIAVCLVAFSLFARSARTETDTIQAMIHSFEKEGDISRKYELVNQLVERTSGYDIDVQKALFDFGIRDIAFEKGKVIVKGNYEIFKFDQRIKIQSESELPKQVRRWISDKIGTAPNRESYRLNLSMCERNSHSTYWLAYIQTGNMDKYGGIPSLGGFYSQGSTSVLENPNVCWICGDGNKPTVKGRPQYIQTLSNFTTLSILEGNSITPEFKNVSQEIVANDLKKGINCSLQEQWGTQSRDYLLLLAAP